MFPGSFQKGFFSSWKQGLTFHSNCNLMKCQPLLSPAKVAYSKQVFIFSISLILKVFILNVSESFISVSIAWSYLCQQHKIIYVNSVKLNICFWLLAPVSKIYFFLTAGSTLKKKNLTYITVTLQISYICNYGNCYIVSTSTLYYPLGNKVSNLENLV